MSPETLPPGDLDTIIDMVVSDAEIDEGIPNSIVISRSRQDGRGSVITRRKSASDDGRTRSRPNLATWTDEEEAFLDESLGKLSLNEIAKHLGRSTNAVKIRFTRLGLAAPSKRPDEITCLQIARIMGKCGKSIGRLIDEGRMPGHQVPTADRKIRVVNKTALKRWLINTDNWIYFDWRRLKDPHLRRLCELKAQRWNDRWLTTRQAAKIIGCHHSDVNRWIHAGKIKRARWWANWNVLRSEAETISIPKGKGTGHEKNWPEEGDVFLVLARAVGHSCCTIARMMGSWWDTRVEYRLRRLRNTGKLGILIADHGLDIQFREGGYTPILFADWRDHAVRFPRIRSNVALLLAGEKLQYSDWLALANVLRAWARWYVDEDDRIELALKTLHAITPRTSADTRVLKAWDLMRCAGIDPFTGGP